MYISRLADGTLILEVRWREFADAWASAPLAERVALDDGRPAVIRHDRDGGQPSFLTVYPTTWGMVRHRLMEAFAGERPTKRTRRCQACDSILTVAREYPQAWTFKCPACGGREVWGKNLVGGTRGAGEEEKR